MPAFDAFFARLAQLQVRRAGALVLLAFACAVASLPLVARLGLDTTFEALLPRDKPSVRDLELIRGRTGGLSTLTVAIESPQKNVPAMQKLASDLVPKLEAMQDAGVRSVEWNIAEYEDFVRSHKELYASVADLDEIRDSLEERIEYERAQKNPMFFDLSDEEPPSADELIERLEKKSTQGKSKLDRFPDGYYVHPDHDLLVVFLRTDIRGGDVTKAEALISRINQALAELDPKKYSPDLTLEYAGDLLHAREEHEAIANELVLATVLTAVCVLAAIVLFFRRLRVLPLLGLGLTVPVLMTFALAQLIVGNLNTSTAFLASIVVGNGINPYIIWLSRYFEEREGQSDTLAAITQTHRGTWAGTLAASLAAGISYASLMLTDFRGFRDFGIIGGIGMVLCWFGSLLVLAPLVALYERYRPLRLGDARRESTLFGEVFTRPVFAWPRAVLVASLAAGIASIVAAGVFVLKDPIEYDFRNLKSVREASSRASSINGRVKDMVGSSAAGQGIALVLPTVEEAEHTKGELQHMIDTGTAQFSRVRSLNDLLPQEQAEKIPRLQKLRELLLDARRFANEKQQKQIDENLPAENVHPLTLADLPASVSRAFTERDGTRGRILFVEQKKDVSLWDGRYLVEWAKNLRTLRMLDGGRPPLAGQAPVFADMLEVVWRDGPKAVLLSFAATVLLVLLAFRRNAERFLSLSSLLLGVLLMVGAMAVFDVKLNFLNFVVFPIAFGIGVDYSINVLRRYVGEKAGGTEEELAIRRAISATGGAVFLCSLTTIIGYGSLFVSANRALNSFGLAAFLSEITTVITAVATMPALMLWLHRRRKSAP